MKHKLLLLFFLSLMLNFSLQSQCTPAYSLTCENAPIVNDADELSGITCMMPAIHNSPGILGCRDTIGAPEYNTVWYKFIARTTSISFEVRAFSCQNVDGLQVGIIEDCNPNRSIVCDRNCIYNTSLTIQGAFEIGNVYSLFLRGCNGAICDYQITVNGSGTAGRRIPFLTSIYEDTNNNCSYDSNEKRKRDITVIDSFNQVKTTISHQTYYNILKSNYGRHYFKLDYKNPYATICSDWLIKDIDSSTNDINLEYGIKSFITCPLMNVDVNLKTVARFCEIWEYDIHYANIGTETARNVSVALKLDNHMVYISSSIQPSSINLPYLYFNLPDVSMFESGYFILNVKNDCNATKPGMTHCVEAHIYPDSLCNVSTLWNKASLKISSTCDKDKVIFDIWNAGTGDMDQLSKYFIVEDDILPMQSSEFKLNKNQHLFIERPSNGMTYRLFVNQVKNHPGNSAPTLAVEYCGYQQNPNVAMSLGYVNMFKEDDEDLFVDKQCNQSVSSFDPNDKIGSPTGYGINSIIDRANYLEYLIRFQNTGPDTAFKVVLKDRLDDNLDLSSFEMVAASSPNYTYTIKDRLLEVRFLRILLPPQSQDDPGSQGYFKFKIKPNANAILGSKIHNTAEIYFDYNLPVITNQVSHQLLKDIISVGLNPVDKFKDLVAIIPNPNSGIFSIKLHERYEHAYLRILNQMGQTVFTQKGIKNNCIISKSLLPEGIYFIEISKHQLPKLNSKFIVIKNE